MDRQAIVDEELECSGGRAPASCDHFGADTILVTPINLFPQVLDKLEELLLEVAIIQGFIELLDDKVKLVCTTPNSNKAVTTFLLNSCTKPLLAACYLVFTICTNRDHLVAPVPA